MKVLAIIGATVFGVHLFYGLIAFVIWSRDAHRQKELEIWYDSQLFQSEDT